MGRNRGVRPGCSHPPGGLSIVPRPLATGELSPLGVHRLNPVVGVEVGQITVVRLSIAAAPARDALVATLRRSGQVDPNSLAAVTNVAKPFKEILLLGQSFLNFAVRDFRHVARWGGYWSACAGDGARGTGRRRRC